MLRPKRTRGSEPEEVDTSPLVPCKGSMPAARKIRTCLVAFLSFYEKRNLMHMFENDSASAHCLYAVSTIVTCLSTMFLLTWSCDSISSSVFGSCRRNGLRRLTMVNWNDEQYQRERYKDLVRAVDQQRLIQAARAARSRPTAVYAPLLAWLGQQFIAWGWRLRARYGALETRVTNCACQEPCG